jgi:hypothetical protein
MKRRCGRRQMVRYQLPETNTFGHRRCDKATTYGTAPSVYFQHRQPVVSDSLESRPAPIRCRFVACRHVSFHTETFSHTVTVLSLHFSSLPHSLYFARTDKHACCCADCRFMSINATSVVPPLLPAKRLLADKMRQL